jgi:hypothetical protein
MRRSAFVIGLAVLLVAAMVPASAHDNFRIIGTVTRLQKTLIDVKNADGKTVTIRLDKQTAVTRDKKKIDVAELKTGQSVVVDAYGDSEADLLALEVRIVPPITKR